MIRPALEYDIPQILPMLHRFHEAAGMAEYADIDDATLEKALRGYIRGDMAHVLVSGPVAAITGTACVLAVSIWFNCGVLEASDLWLWVEPASRGSRDGLGLLKEMESWAESKGARPMFLETLDDLYPQGRDRAYARLGYEPHARIYIKRL